MDLSALPPKPTAKQIAAQLRSEIGDQRYLPGDRLTPARDLAKQLKVQLNTVQSAYGQLRDEGLVVSQQGRGTFVRDPSVPLGAEPGSSPAYTALATELSGIHDALRQLGERMDHLERLVEGRQQAEK
ncbi:winged helix-turn-helix transcriptional regulator [Streptomyces sp. A7024]|uniref:Winged helix-turn-helix transcriptional regulator n=1 Tax=Streptomyces coryli TaxID=1128680 RepID=A0A6G4U8K1_9ACTN|nr:winged helix-turn-helix domain-containing protein [Streptomyces coryli]NGN68575.1 winged helix-turn-helix transcriptional regulator [Streptomyces coryli]